jgi:hypothetical protein
MLLSDLKWWGYQSISRGGIINLSLDMSRPRGKERKAQLSTGSAPLVGKETKDGF